VQLDLCEGPICARCGCNDTRIVQRPMPTWWMSGRAVCNHCGFTFPFRELPASAPTEVVTPAEPEITAAAVPPVRTRRRG